MGRILTKIPCPRHVDKTPSLVVYADGWAHCYSCGQRTPAASLGFSQEKKEVEEEKYVEDVEASIRRIEALPKRRIRGHVFPCDGTSYYIVFPDRNYYRRRFFAPDANGGKYRSPAGVSRPSFVLAGKPPSRLAIFVEGEINALSIKACAPAAWVFCPGGAGDFGRVRELYSGALGQCDRVVGILDRDAAGARAGLALNGEVWPRKLEVQLWHEDANDLFQIGALRNYLEACLDLSREAAMSQLGKENVQAFGG